MARYHGERGWPFNCSNIEDLNKALANGEWFRLKTMGFYYRNIPFVVNYGSAPANILCFRMVCITSVNTQYTRFFRIIEDKDNSNAQIYYGESLNQLICDELRDWALNMNPKTLRAFSGKSFVSYLNAIPRDVLVQDGFSERMKKALQSGFVTRIKTAKLSSQTDLDEIEEMATKSLEVMQTSLKKANEDQSQLQKATEKAMQNTIARIEDIYK